MQIIFFLQIINTNIPVVNNEYLTICTYRYIVLCSCHNIFKALNKRNHVKRYRSLIKIINKTIKTSL